MFMEPALLLRKNGLQVTAQRLAVMRAVSQNPHCSADYVAQAVRAELGTISRQAVYDVLGVLVDKGILRRIQPAGSAALYEDQVHDNHHHLICRQCGLTTDIDAVIGESDCLVVARNSGYQVDQAEVVFWGLCPQCAGRDVNSSLSKKESL